MGKEGKNLFCFNFYLLIYVVIYWKSVSSVPFMVHEDKMYWILVGDVIRANTSFKAYKHLKKNLMGVCLILNTYIFKNY